MKLTIRQQNILRATVHHYVNTAEPVGSKSLVSGYDLQVSSATIRNAMSALEDSGFLYQPYTSAGRIPSDTGYRAYVDQLMVLSEPLTRQMETALSQNLTQHLNHQLMEGLLQESAQMLARLSGYIALVTMPHRNEAVIKHLQLVRVREEQLLLVVIDSYETYSMLMAEAAQPESGIPAGMHATERFVSDEELQILSNFLTERFEGKALQDVNLNGEDLDLAFQQYACGLGDRLRQAIGEMTRRSQSAPATQILVSGLAEVLSQPEFAEPEQLRTIVELLEDGRDQLWPLIASSRLDHSEKLLSSDTGRPLRIWIGTESPIEPMHACALVTTTYGNAPGPVGSLGILGPTRMLYENAVAAVEAAANCLTEAVAETFELGNQLTLEG
ncbi:MAG: heat-inducible transcriptional repressor HrcA [Cyanobacteria bacterium P01_D01_bin.105]